MVTALRVLARIISSTGLLAIGVLHLVWASGRPWPAKNTAELSEAVVGQKIEMPGKAATAVVGVGAIGSGLAASGLLGSCRMLRLPLRLLSFVMLIRGVLGGQVALKVLRLPKAGAKFIALDEEYYRPFATLMGVSLLIVSAKR